MFKKSCVIKKVAKSRTLKIGKITTKPTYNAIIATFFKFFKIIGKTKLGFVKGVVLKIF